jgi:hypothetical protein
MDAVLEAVLRFGFIALLVLIAIAGLAAVLTAMARPNPKDEALLIDSFPGEAIVAFRAANAVMAGVKPNLLMRLCMDALGASKGLRIATELMERSAGGLWVGGRCFLTTHRLVFMPNVLNRLLQSGVPVVAVNLSAVSGSSHRFGLVTRIIDVRTEAGIFSLRMAKAAEFQAHLERLRGETPPSTPSTEQ